MCVCWSFSWFCQTPYCLSIFRFEEIDEILILPRNSTIWRHNNVKLCHCANNLKMMNITFCVILVTLPWVLSKLYGGGGRTAKPPFSRSQEAQIYLVLIGLVQFDSINLVYFSITVIISIHLSKSSILFHIFFRSRSKWYWSASKETLDIREGLSKLLNQKKAENFSRTGAFCFMVTNSSKLEMDKCEGKHYYICEDYRGRLKKRWTLKWG